jgi:3-oxoadipate enol-lactonase
MSEVDRTPVIDVPLAAAPIIPVAEAMSRWRREAWFGVCDTGRYRARYFVWGQGPPLVLIHGLLDRAASFVPLVAHLSRSFRCLAYDLPEGAEDAAQMAKLTHDHLVLDLLRLIDQARWEQTSVVGYSLGGTIAMKALAQSPRRFLRAVFVSSFALRRLAPAERALATMTRRWRGRIGELPGWRWFERLVTPGEVFPAHGADHFHAILRQIPIRAATTRALWIHDLDLRGLLPSIRHPVMVISGDRDTAVRRESRDELARGFPHADTLELRDCGHFSPFTHTPVLAAAIERFLMPPCGLK